MLQSDFRKLAAEFEAFFSVPIPPASTVPIQITRRIRRDLIADRIRRYARLLFVHLAGATVSLTLCSQFGITFFGSRADLSESFMNFGPVVCMMACGFFFMSVSLFAATMLLKPFELLAIRRHRLLEIGTISVVSLGFFALVGAHNIGTGTAAAWLFGAIAGGITILELGWGFHRWAHHHHK